MKRVLTALALIPLVVYIVILGSPWLVLGVVALVASICFREYCGMAAQYGFGTMGPLGYAAGLLILTVQDNVLVWVTVLALLGLALSLRSDDLRTMLPRAALLLFGVVYIFGCWKFAIALRACEAHWLLYVLALTWVGDIAAYYAGSRFGRHKLAPGISPGKSWEGSLTSLAAAVVFGYFYLRRFLPAVPTIEAVGLSIAANIAGQAGDLCESAIKRGAEVKDSSTLLPGHGGLLDRVDSTLFALPLVYLYTTLRF